jgi:small nuclear ribonucleoprotein (snRNP)-like protein
MDVIVRNVLEDCEYKRVQITKTDGNKLIGVVEQISEDFVLIAINEITEQIFLNDIRDVTPLPKHYPPLQ